MRNSTIALSVVLLFLASCRKEDASAPAPVPGVVGEDGRYDCADSAMSPAEQTQWDWLSKGFRLGNGNRESFADGDFRIRLVRREPSGPELLLQIERSGGRAVARLIRPRANLYREFVSASMEKGLVAGLWEPRTALDTLALPDSLAQAGVALFEEKGRSGWTSMRRCDTSTHMPSPLGEALYVIEVASKGNRALHALRPGHYAEGFWNRLQHLIDDREKFSQGVGF